MNYTTLKVSCATYNVDYATLIVISLCMFDSVLLCSVASLSFRLFASLPLCLSASSRFALLLPKIPPRVCHR